jgi:hypothetical protein
VKDKHKLMLAHLGESLLVLTEFLDSIRTKGINGSIRGSKDCVDTLDIADCLSQASGCDELNKL